jgi:hypothetical protein
MFMPIKPATPDRIAPSAKPAAEIGPSAQATMPTTTMPTMPIVVYWRFR